jgi:hypothetical protein
MVASEVERWACGDPKSGFMWLLWTLVLTRKVWRVGLKGSMGGFFFFLQLCLFKKKLFKKKNKFFKLLKILKNILKKHHKSRY